MAANSQYRVKKADACPCGVGRIRKRAFGVAKRPREISSVKPRRQKAYFFRKWTKSQKTRYPEANLRHFELTYSRGETQEFVTKVRGLSFETCFCQYEVFRANLTWVCSDLGWGIFFLRAFRLSWDPLSPRNTEKA